MGGVASPMRDKYMIYGRRGSGGIRVRVRVRVRVRIRARVRRTDFLFFNYDDVLGTSLSGG